MAKQKRIDPIHVLIEIGVITVGIILAYQLNTMSENNKTKESERKSLLEIRSNLEIDLIDLEANMGAHKNAIATIDTLQNWVGEYHERIGPMFFLVFRDYLFLPQTSAFESLKSKGVDLITNDSIRVNTQRLYDFYYQILKQYESEYEANRLYDDFEWVAINYYKTFPIRENTLPEPKKRSSKWLKDDELNVRISIAKHEHLYALRTCKTVKEKLEELILAIDQELK